MRRARTAELRRVLLRISRNLEAEAREREEDEEPHRAEGLRDARFTVRMEIAKLDRPARRGTKKASR